MISREKAIVVGLASVALIVTSLVSLLENDDRFASDGAFALTTRSSKSRKLEALARHYNLTEEELTDLNKVLGRAAAIDNGRLIITNLNQAWAAQGSMVDLFLESFRVGVGTSSLLNHLVILAMDRASFQRCLLIHTHCIALKTQQVDFSGKKFFMSEDFLKMMWRRMQFLSVALELGFDFIFTDADVLWFRDPFQHLNTSNADLDISCDAFIGDPADPRNAPNTGFFHVRASNKTIRLFRFWHNAKDMHPGFNEQMVLKQVRGTQAFQELGLSIRYLPTELFGGFCEAGKDLSKIYTVHANCCTGLQRKLKDMRLVLSDWKTLGKQGVQWTAPKECKFLSFGI